MHDTPALCLVQQETTLVPTSIVFRCVVKWLLTLARDFQNASVALTYSVFFHPHPERLLDNLRLKNAGAPRRNRSRTTNGRPTRTTSRSRHERRRHEPNWLGRRTHNHVEMVLPQAPLDDTEPNRLERRTHDYVEMVSLQAPLDDSSTRTCHRILGRRRPCVQHKSYTTVSKLRVIQEGTPRNIPNPKLLSTGSGKTSVLSGESKESRHGQPEETQIKSTKKTDPLEH